MGHGGDGIHFYRVYTVVSDLTLLQGNFHLLGVVLPQVRLQFKVDWTEQFCSELSVIQLDGHP